MIWGGHDGAVADRRPFGLGCSLPALDAAGYGHRPALVPLRFGNAVAFLEICIKFTAPAATASGEQTATSSKLV